MSHDIKFSYEIGVDGIYRVFESTYEREGFEELHGICPQPYHFGNYENAHKVQEGLGL